jgi:hypothetical protein
MIRNASSTLVNLTGPANAWFAFAINSNSTIMENATAFVYTRDNTGVPVLQVRQLANHAPGTLLSPKYPANITMLDSKTAQVREHVIAICTSPLQVLFYLSSLEYPMLQDLPIDPILSMTRFMHPYAEHKRGPVIGPMSYTCFLFAQGTDSMDLGYHGAFRGTTCFYSD